MSEKNYFNINVSDLLGNNPAKNFRSQKTADEMEAQLDAILQKNTKPSYLKRLKKKGNKLLLKIDKFRYTLKQGFVNVPYPYGVFVVSSVENPCRVCGTETTQNILRLRLLGYIVIENKAPHNTKNCCVLAQELKKLVAQEEYRQEQLYALRYPFASPE